MLFVLAEGGVQHSKLGLRASGTRHLRTLARPQFDVVHHGTRGNILERQRVSNQDVGFRAGVDRAPHFETHRANNVALLAIGVVQQRDVRGAVGVVFDVSDLRWNPVLASLEVDLAIQPLGPATAVARGLAPAGVAPA